MRKSDKKIDNQIRLALTRVCHTALDQFDGFQWLTHRVDYQAFPKSLQVICVFQTNEAVRQHRALNENRQLSTLVQRSLRDVGVAILPSRITYDSEENGANGKYC